jgi:transposase
MGRIMWFSPPENIEANFVLMFSGSKAKNPFFERIANMAVYYVGADVHLNNTELAVEHNKEIIRRFSVPTTIPTIRSALEELGGRCHLTFEEGPMAGWLYRNLKSVVESITVCDPRRNKLIACDGDKDDVIDSGKLATLLRGKFLRPVYHDHDAKQLELKQWIKLYHDFVKSATRNINKVRGCCRGEGIRIPSRTVKDIASRQQWLDGLENQVLAEQVCLLWQGYDTAASQARVAKRQLERRIRGNAVLQRWSELAGIGVIRATTIYAYMDTPWRFKTKSRLWKYCGVGLQRSSSGKDAKGRQKIGQLELFWQTNKMLKNAVMGAAMSAIRQKENEFSQYYERMLSAGIIPGNARHSVARRMVTVL